MYQYIVHQIKLSYLINDKQTVYSKTIIISHIPAYFSEIKGNDSDYPSNFLSPPSASSTSAAEENKSIDALDFIQGGSQ